MTSRSQDCWQLLARTSYEYFARFDSVKQWPTATTAAVSVHKKPISWFVCWIVCIFTVIWWWCDSYDSLVGGTLACLLCDSNNIVYIYICMCMCECVCNGNWKDSSRCIINKQHQQHTSTQHNTTCQQATNSAERRHK